VYSLFKVLADDGLFVQFKRLCDLSYYNEEMRSVFKEDLKRDDLTDLERAFRFFYVNRSSHNGIGGFSMNMVVRRNMAKSVSDYLSTVDRLTEIHQRLSKVMIYNRDAFDLMEKYSRDNVFMYVDPPYVLSTRSSAERYAVDMTDEQQERLIDICANSKAKLLISGYDCELYDKLLDNGFTKASFTVNTIDGARNPKTKVESLWLNYEIDDTKEENN
jgi:DNA adenine methylase